jgi:hypothetical protein
MSRQLRSRLENHPEDYPDLPRVNYCDEKDQENHFPQEYQDMMRDLLLKGQNLEFGHHMGLVN